MASQNTYCFSPMWILVRNRKRNYTHHKIVCLVWHHKTRTASYLCGFWFRKRKSNYLYRPGKFNNISQNTYCFSPMWILGRNRKCNYTHHEIVCLVWHHKTRTASYLCGFWVRKRKYNYTHQEIVCLVWHHKTRTASLPCGFWLETENVIIQTGK